MPDEETSILEQARKRWKAVQDCEFEKKVRDLSDLKYFTGEDQGWDEDGARAKLREEDRPALTLNKIAPIVRLMTGARPKIEMTYSPVEEGDLETAQVFNACGDHIDRQNAWEFLSNDIFLNMIINKGAVVGIEPDYNSDPRGDIGLSLYDRHEFWFDPESKRKDRRDGGYCFREARVSKEEAKRMFPRKADEIDSMAANTSSSGGKSIHSRELPDQYADSREDYYDPVSEKFSIIYYWYKDYKNTAKIIDLATGQIIDSTQPKWKIEDALEETGAKDRLKVIEREDTAVKYLVFAYDIELEQGITPWERQDGQKSVLSEQIPFICFELDRLFAGTRQELISLIDNFKDPQKFYNKLSSAVIHIIGTTANSGWEYEEGISPELEDTIKHFGSKAGVNIPWPKGYLAEGRARKIQPTSPPVGQIEYADRLSAALLDISGIESLVSTQALGKGASGRAIDLKQRQGGNIISWVYDTFDFYVYLLAEFKRDAIQTLFDYEKVIRIKGERNKYIKINEAQYDERGDIAQILNDVTTGKYDTVITRNDALPTIRLERFRYFSELVKSGALPLPPPVMLKIVMSLMDDPGLKDLIEEEFGNFTQQAQMLQQGEGAPMPQPVAAGAAGMGMG